MKELNLKYLNALSVKCRRDIMRMINKAGSGHTGGSLSSVDIYILLRYLMKKEDRLVVSHGHTAAGLYSVLGNMGYFNIEDAVENFRKSAPFEGHPSIALNGVEWCSGSLGQGLSVGCGFALAKKLKNESGTVYVVMGDGEQQKGQLQEAREFAVTHKLDNLVAIVDFNGLQASGNIDDICRQSLENKYKMSGWETVVADGHDYLRLYEVLKNRKGLLCILAQTVMGKGVKDIENDYKFHGTPPGDELLQKSLEELSLSEEDLQIIEDEKKNTCEFLKYSKPHLPYTPKVVYNIGDKVEVRSALGKALSDVADENPDVYITALDCDLEGSVKLGDFKKKRPRFFVECGIAENNASSVASAMSKSGIITVHADFSVFNIAETYSQNRMADINKATVKLFSTHAGLDVGEDGKTHQCTDYISLLSNLHGFKVIVPADANQADAVVRYALADDSAVAVIAGRSKLPVICDINGEALGFEYGKAQWLKKGTDGVIITYGNMVHRAVNAVNELEAEGVSIGVINMSTPVHIDKEAVLNATKTGLIVTYEDHNVNSGIGGAVARVICENGEKCRLLCKGISKYGASAKPDKLYEEQGLDIKSLKEDIKNILK